MRHGPETWSFRSDDLDEVREFVRARFGDHSRVTKGTGRLGFEFSGAACEGVVAARVVAQLPSVIRAAVATTTLHLPLHGRYSYRIGRRLFEVSPGHAMLIAAGHDYTLQSSPGLVLALQLDARLLAPELNARLRSRALRSRPFPRAFRLPAAPAFRRNAAAVARRRLLGMVWCAGSAPFPCALRAA